MSYRNAGRGRGRGERNSGRPTTPEYDTETTGSFPETPTPAPRHRRGLRASLLRGTSSPSRSREQHSSPRWFAPENRTNLTLRPQQQQQHQQQQQPPPPPPPQPASSAQSGNVQRGNNPLYFGPPAEFLANVKPPPEQRNRLPARNVPVQRGQTPRRHQREHSFYTPSQHNTMAGTQDNSYWGSKWEHQGTEQAANSPEWTRTYVPREDSDSDVFGNAQEMQAAGKTAKLIDISDDEPEASGLGTVTGDGTSRMSTVDRHGSRTIDVSADQSNMARGFEQLTLAPTRTAAASSAGRLVDIEDGPQRHVMRQPGTQASTQSRAPILDAPTPTVGFKSPDELRREEALKAAMEEEEEEEEGTKRRKPVHLSTLQAFRAGGEMEEMVEDYIDEELDKQEQPQADAGAHVVIDEEWMNTGNVQERLEKIHIMVRNIWWQLHGKLKEHAKNKELVSSFTDIFESYGQSWKPSLHEVQSNFKESHIKRLPMEAAEMWHKKLADLVKRIELDLLDIDEFLFHYGIMSIRYTLREMMDMGRANAPPSDAESDSASEVGAGKGAKLGASGRMGKAFNTTPTGASADRDNNKVIQGFDSTIHDDRDTRLNALAGHSDPVNTTLTVAPQSLAPGPSESMPLIDLSPEKSARVGNVPKLPAPARERACVTKAAAHTPAIRPTTGSVQQQSLSANTNQETHQGVSPTADDDEWAKMCKEMEDTSALASTQKSHSVKDSLI